MTDVRTSAINHLQALLSGNGGKITDNLDVQDNAFVNMATLTACRRLTYIADVIKKLTGKKLSTQKTIARMALILGTTEILYMNSPDYAVINSYVDIVKTRSNRFAAGFVNAVLHKINNQKQQILKADKGAFFPKEFIALLEKSYTKEIVHKIEQASLKEPALDITLLDENSTITNLGERLPLGSLRLKNNGKISELPDYDSGKWLVQDFASAIPVKMLGNLRGKKVLDICAAPGGKTAQLIAQGAKVTALDISETRLNILRANLQRLNLQAENIICADALEYLQDSKEIYDITLLDAPCSATGTLRRHPEIVHTKGISDVIKSAKLQQQLLELAKDKVALDGCLLYCTCSLCQEEGEEQIKNFLACHSDWRADNLAALLPEEIAEIGSVQGFIRILPAHLRSFGGADGFFVALLRREI